MHTHIHTYIHMHIHAYIHKHIHAYIHTYIHANIYINNIRICTFMCMNAWRICSYGVGRSPRSRQQHTNGNQYLPPLRTCIIIIICRSPFWRRFSHRLLVLPRRTVWYYSHVLVHHSYCMSEGGDGKKHSIYFFDIVCHVLLKINTNESNRVPKTVWNNAGEMLQKSQNKKGGISQNNME